MSTDNTAAAAVESKPTTIKTTTSSSPTRMAPLFAPKLQQFPTQQQQQQQQQPEKKQEDEEEDVPMTKPVTLAEKRARQAKRAYQIKTWRVREEREAREARTLLRKKLMNGEGKKRDTVVDTTITTQKKKNVRFNLKKNKIIQITEQV